MAPAVAEQAARDFLDEPPFFFDVWHRAGVRPRFFDTSRPRTVVTERGETRLKNMTLVGTKY